MGEKKPGGSGPSAGAVRFPPSNVFFGRRGRISLLTSAILRLTHYLNRTFENSTKVSGIKFGFRRKLLGADFTRRDCGPKIIFAANR